MGTIVKVKNMTNRNNIRPYSAGVTIKTIKKPRLRKCDLTFDGPPPPTPEGIGNGVRPHGGYRGKIDGNKS